jgi:hypothetical protein
MPFMRVQIGTFGIPQRAREFIVPDDIEVSKLIPQIARVLVPDALLKGFVSGCYLSTQPKFPWSGRINSNTSLENAGIKPASRLTLFPGWKLVIAQGIIFNPLTVFINVLIFLVLSLTLLSIHLTGMEHTVAFKKMRDTLITNKEDLQGSLQKLSGKVDGVVKAINNINDRSKQEKENPLHLTFSDDRKSIILKHSIADATATIQEIHIEIHESPENYETVCKEAPTSQKTLSANSPPLIHMPNFNRPLLDSKCARDETCAAKLSVTFLFLNQPETQEWKCSLVRLHEDVLIYRRP